VTTGTGVLRAERSGDRSLASLVIPRQHGAWSVLLLSFALGVGGLGRFGTQALLLLVAVALGFVARHAVGAYLKLSRNGRRNGQVLVSAGVCAFAAGLSGGAVLVCYDRPLMLPLGGVLLAFGGVSTLLEWKRRDRSVWGELANMLGLSLVTPLAAYATTGTLTSATFGLWVVSALFFCSSVFHVRYLVRGRIGKAGLGFRLRVGAWSVLFHLGAAAATLALGLAGAVPVWTWVAMAPNAGKAIWAVAHYHPAPAPIRRIGLVELAHALVFVLLVVAVFRTAVAAPAP